MRKTKKKQLMILAKALHAKQPAGMNYSVRQIAQRLKAFLKEQKHGA